MASQFEFVVGFTATITLEAGCLMSPSEAETVREDAVAYFCPLGRGKSAGGNRQCLLSLSLAVLLLRQTFTSATFMTNFVVKSSEPLVGGWVRLGRGQGEGWHWALGLRGS
jgi:hypothetical protein